MKAIKICYTEGECLSAHDFAKQAGVLLNQTTEQVEYALSFMIPDLGLVDALTTYGDICGIETY